MAMITRQQRHVLHTRVAEAQTISSFWTTVLFFCGTILCVTGLSHSFCGREETRMAKVNGILLIKFHCLLFTLSPNCCVSSLVPYYCKFI